MASTWIKRRTTAAVCAAWSASRIDVATGTASERSRASLLVGRRH